MIANQPMNDMTHLDMCIRPGSSKFVGHGALRRTRRSSLEVGQIDWLCLMQSDFKNFDDQCSR